MPEASGRRPEAKRNQSLPLRQLDLSYQTYLKGKPDSSNRDEDKGQDELGPEAQLRDEDGANQAD